MGSPNWALSQERGAFEDLIGIWTARWLGGPTRPYWLLLRSLRIIRMKCLGLKGLGILPGVRMKKEVSSEIWGSWDLGFGTRGSGFGFLSPT